MEEPIIEEVEEEDTPINYKRIVCPYCVRVSWFIEINNELFDPSSKLKIKDYLICPYHNCRKSFRREEAL